MIKAHTLKHSNLAYISMEWIWLILIVSDWVIIDIQAPDSILKSCHSSCEWYWNWKISQVHGKLIKPHTLKHSNLAYISMEWTWLILFVSDWVFIDIQASDSILKSCHSSCEWYWNWKISLSSWEIDQTSYFKAQ